VFLKAAQLSESNARQEASLCEYTDTSIDIETVHMALDKNVQIDIDTKTEVTVSFDNISSETITIDTATTSAPLNTLGTIYINT
jgi:hypothetical protein